MGQGLRLLVVGALVGGCPTAPAPPDSGATAAALLAAREAALARREADLAAREAMLSVREQALTQREVNVARRESLNAVPPEEREKVRREAEAVRARVHAILAQKGLDLRDVTGALLDYLDRGDALMKDGDWLAARVAYGTAEAFAHGFVVEEKQVRAALGRAQARLEAETMPARRAQWEALLLRARGLLADRKLGEALRLIKQVEGPPPAPAADGGRP